MLLPLSRMISENLTLPSLSPYPPPLPSSCPVPLKLLPYASKQRRRSYFEPRLLWRLLLSSSTPTNSEDIAISRPAYTALTITATPSTSPEVAYLLLLVPLFSRAQRFRLTRVGPQQQLLWCSSTILFLSLLLSDFFIPVHVDISIIGVLTAHTHTYTYGQHLYLLCTYS